MQLTNNNTAVALLLATCACFDHRIVGLKVPIFELFVPLSNESEEEFLRRIKEAGALLKQLAEERLAGDTIVFFYGDNGMGLPRGKRCLWDTGLQEPLLVRVPDKFRALAPAAPDFSKTQSQTTSQQARLNVSLGPSDARSAASPRRAETKVVTSDVR